MDKEVTLDGSVNGLMDKISSMHSECNVKDDLVIKHAKVAEEAIAGWEKAEAEVVFLKQELNGALRRTVIAEGRVADLDAALKECMQQLRSNKEEQEQKIHDAIMHVCREHEQEWMLLEEKLGETSKRLSKIDLENSHLSKALQIKDKLIEGLRKSKSQAEAEYSALVTRLGSEEKGSIRLADASHRQQMESMKKTFTLEKECQRLRLLGQKQLCSPTLAEKQNGTLEKESEQFNSQLVGLIPKNYTWNTSPSKKVDFLIEKLHVMEEENRTLKEAMTNKNIELQSLRSMVLAPSNSCTLVNLQTPVELARSTLSPGPSLASLSESVHEDEISCSESWASALITELEYFTCRNQKETLSCHSLGVSGINLMDDFVEMEKLATLSVDKSFEYSNISSHERKSSHPLGADLLARPSTSSCKDVVRSSSGNPSQETQSNDISCGKYPDWLQDIVRLFLRQSCMTEKHLDEIVEEVRVALASMRHPGSIRVMNARENSGTFSFSDPLQTPPNVQKVSSFQTSGPNASMNQPSIEKDVNKSICRIIELIEGIDQPSLLSYDTSILSEDNGSSLKYKNIEAPSGYMVRVFQWKNSELFAVLQQFVHTCHDLINGKAAFEIFARELCSALEWIFNHCFSIQDVSRMKDTVKNHFDWDESESESELELECSQLDGNTVNIFKGQICPSSTAASNGQTSVFHMEEFQLENKEETVILKQKLTNMESVQKDLEGKLQTATERIEELLIQLRELEQSVGDSQRKLEPYGVVDNQTENVKSLRADLDSQLMDAKNELNVACQNTLSLELELENKINRCQELETTCIALQLQLDSMTKSEVQKCATDQGGGQLQKDWEITAASEKLAECQETILSLGKQLKAFAAPNETTLLVKGNHRCSLLEKMLTEDNANLEQYISPRYNETMHSMVDRVKSLANPSDVPNPACDLDCQVKSQERLLCSKETKCTAKAAAGQAVTIVPSTRCGGVSMLRKIMLRRKRENGKKIPHHDHLIHA
ncbi:Filament-like plant protein [Thalictrum thalictroides]|uniref:Filament-like plant protein n=1 Tax=Thalictrum thalictroides TaxID=46969 RepID=A0A7J6XGL1_THATH|nr:Filament-like plant protein [Thalictrum thalictroides]